MCLSGFAFDFFCSLAAFSSRIRFRLSASSSALLGDDAAEPGGVGPTLVVPAAGAAALATDCAGASAAAATTPVACPGAVLRSPPECSSRRTRSASSKRGSGSGPGATGGAHDAPQAAGTRARICSSARSIGSTSSSHTRAAGSATEAHGKSRTKPRTVLCFHRTTHGPAAAVTENCAAPSDRAQSLRTISIACSAVLTTPSSEILVANCAALTRPICQPRRSVTRTETESAPAHSATRTGASGASGRRLRHIGARGQC
mmetsp:Transcript_9739/g.28929  ORF Transcript_9739/g.28929 Transcript_9739/m.28929 type:complete len:259 (+) Transcript_9739:277-1053(+)